MKWKIIVAALALVAIGAVIFAATVAALNDGNYDSSTASSSNRGPYWYGEGEDGYREDRESGMINLWGAQDGADAYFDDDWIGMR